MKGKKNPLIATPAKDSEFLNFDTTQKTIKKIVPNTNEMTNACTINAKN